MDIHHKIKPRDGWRDFFGEVGIIVLGVLLALAAEQLVEALHWRHRVELGRDALNQDVAMLRFNTQERAILKPCLLRRIVDLRSVLDKASAAGMLPKMGELRQPPRRSWHLTSWSSLASAQVATHFPRQELFAYSSIADFGDAIDRINEDELRAWTTLKMMEGGRRRLSDAEAVQLRMALTQAAFSSQLMDLTAAQMDMYLEESGQKLSEEDRQSLNKELAAVRKSSRSAARCGFSYKP